MQPMAISQKRRRLLKAALMGAALPTVVNTLSGCRGNTAAARCELLGCALSRDGSFAVVGADPSGQPVFRLPLPDRGHGVAAQRREVGTLGVAFARRPGDFMQVFDYQRGVTLSRIRAASDRYFYGHGAISDDGKWLYTTEGKRQTSEGVIGVYQLTAQGQVKKVREISGFGIGPHELALVDTNTLVVGVGGMHTDGRTVLNIDAMSPALVYIDIDSGKVIERAELANKKLSIRHLMVSDEGYVVTGQQYHGADNAPLVAIHRRGEPMKMLDASPEQWSRFNNYVASIATLNGWIVATSPRGNCYGIWSLNSGELLGLHPLIDASGASRDGDVINLSAGSGKMVTLNNAHHPDYKMTPVRWDNHWITLV